MKKVITLFFVFVLSISMFPQAFNWEWLNPKPQGNTLRSIKVLEANTLVAFGNGGTLLKSTDAGSTWKVSLADSVGREFRASTFVSSLVGYACGEAGLLMKTTDGCESGVYLNSTTTELLYSVDFVDADTGYVAGAKGLLLKTTDGGTTWTTLVTPVVATSAIYSVFVQSAENVFIGVATTGAVYRSTDYGATWNNLNLPATKTVWDVFFLDANTGWVAMQNSGAV